MTFSSRQARTLGRPRTPERPAGPDAGNHPYRSSPGWKPF
jgi:hypothetical protein